MRGQAASPPQSSGRGPVGTCRQWTPRSPPGGPLLHSGGNLGQPPAQFSNSQPLACLDTPAHGSQSPPPPPRESTTFSLKISIRTRGQGNAPENHQGPWEGDRPCPAGATLPQTLTKPFLVHTRSLHSGTDPGCPPRLLSSHPKPHSTPSWGATSRPCWAVSLASPKLLAMPSNCLQTFS